MKGYFRYFRWLYIALGLLIIMAGGLSLMRGAAAKIRYGSRRNTECDTTERVFDYADVLSDKEEEKLRSLIAKRERQCGCDIVLVTLDRSLKDEAREIDPYVDYEEFVRIYAEQFYEEHNFGYDRANGDGTILVDNWYREDDGNIYTWLTTTGRAYDKMSDYDVDYVLDDVYRYIERNPYRAYKTYVNGVYRQMTGSGLFRLRVPGWIPWLAGIIAALGFLLFNWNSKKGASTVTAFTYVAGKQAQFPVRQDRFLRKSVTQHTIQTSSSGGSGGGHSSGGGGGHSSGSHGGGGHHR